MLPGSKGPKEKARASGSAGGFLRQVRRLAVATGTSFGVDSGFPRLRPDPRAVWLSICLSQEAHGRPWAPLQAGHWLHRPFDLYA